MFPPLIIALSLLLMVRSQPTSSELTAVSSSTASPLSTSTSTSSMPCENGTIAPPPPTSAPCSPHMTVPPVVLMHGSYQCITGVASTRPARDDYLYSPGVGAHKLHTRAATWNDARKMCNDEGGHLAIVNSLTEAHVMREIFAKAGAVKGAEYTDIAFVGVHDLYKEGEWVTILGDSIFKTGYIKWSDKYGGQPDNGGGRQNCGGFFKDGGLDDINCDSPFAFFCELPMTCFIH